MNSPTRSHAGRFAASAALALSLGAVLAPSALAGNQQATTPYGTFECSDGRTFDITGMPSPRFPIQVGFMDGKGVVARWFDQAFSAKIVAPKEVADVAVAYTPDPFSGPVNRSRRAGALDLSGLATCSSAQDAVSSWELDAETVSLFGLDESFSGAVVDVQEVSSLTVYINAKQVAAR
jgi:hypothetical protein